MFTINLLEILQVTALFINDQLGEEGRLSYGGQGREYQE